MNSELKKCRRHYRQLSSHIKKRPTAQFLLTAIQIAEDLEFQLATVRDLCNEIRASETALKKELARVTKP